MSINPLLAVIYDLGSAGPADIISATRDLCDVIFVYDPRQLRLARQHASLRSAGSVLEIRDWSPSEVARALAPLEPTGITTFSEYQIAFTARVAQECGLSYHDQATAELLTDKFLQRRAFATAGIETTRYACLSAMSSAEDVAAALEVTGVPAVLKPRTGSGSVDTVLVADANQCLTAIGQAAGGAADFVLEELLQGDPAAAESTVGDYVSVESAVFGGQAWHICVTGKFPLAPPFRETGQFVPAVLSPTETQAVMALADTALQAVGVTVGVTHTEIKLTPEGPRLIEVNGRIGGYVDDIVRRSSDTEVLRTAMQLALGQAPRARPVKFERVAFRHYVAAPEGQVILTELKGMERLREIPGVQYIEIRAVPPQRLDSRLGTQECLGVVYGVATDHSELRRVMETIRATVSVQYLQLEGDTQETDGDD